MSALTARRIQSELGSYLNRAETVIVPSEVDPSRLFYLRPSSFPYCGLKYFLDFQKRHEDPRLATLSSGYFTSVGTTAHSVFQAFTAPLGKIVGDWKCPQCGTKTYFTTFAKCECGGHPEYLELELKYKKTVVGHTDALYRFTPSKGKDSIHAVLDYKTTSMRKVREDEELERKGKKGVFPYRGNVAQIKTYIPLLEEQYGIKVDYWSLIYLARDAPFKYGRRIVVHHVDPEAKLKIEADLIRTVKLHRKVLQATTVKDLSVVKKYKLCKSLEDYNRNWKDEHNPCPHCNYCFQEKELDKELKPLLQKSIVPLVQHAPDKIRERLGL